MISSDIKLLFDDLDELSATVEPTATAETVKGVEGWLQKKKETFKSVTRKTSSSKSAKKEKDVFVQKVELFLSKAVELKKNGTFRTWGQFFYRRMQYVKAVLPQKHVQLYKAVFNNYIIALSNSSSTTLPVLVASPLQVAAMELISYLETHYDDPDNSLIGLSPSQDVIKKITLGQSTSPASVCTDSSIEEEKQTYSKLTSRESLMNQILTWSEMRNEATVMQEIKKLAQVIRHGKPLKKGELIVARINNSLVYCRVEEDKHTSVVVFASPSESETTQVNREDVFLLTLDVKDCLKYPKTMEKMVEDPTDKLFERVLEGVKKQTNEFLVQQSVIPSTDIFDRWNTGQATVHDLPAVRKCSEKLKKLLESPPEQLMKQLEDFVNGEVTSFYSHMSAANFYIPTKDKSLDNLQHFASNVRSSLARQRFLRFSAICDSTLDQISVESKEIMNGNKKNELTDWWLSLIKDKVNAFLLQNGYLFDAVPANYIDNPPTSLTDVRNNLNIVKQILQGYNLTQQQILTSSDNLNDIPPQTDMQKNVMQMINSLKTEIYKALDDFIRKSQIILWDYFQVEEEVPFDVQIVESLLKLTKADLSAGNVDWIERVLSDITYVQEMKRLENPSLEKSTKDIVPITGLILNRFHRIENELHTVLEVWEKPDKKGFVAP